METIKNTWTREEVATLVVNACADTLSWSTRFMLDPAISDFNPVEWINKNLPVSEYTTWQKKKINSIKRDIRFYFDGEFTYEPIAVNTPLYALGITDLSFDFSTDSIVNLTITLSSPVMLIGTQGTTIDGLVKYLNRYDSTPVKIHIIESKLWNYFKQE